MLSHCYAPASFCMSTMVHLPKDSGIMGDVKVIINLRRDHYFLPPT